MDSYDFGAKATYRVRVWNEIDKRCTAPKALRRVVYLDTREALETTFLLRRGYEASNLLAVNREPVEVALLTARLKSQGLPAIKTAGVDWMKAMRTRLHPDGAHIINFDGMGCLHIDLKNLLRGSIGMTGASVVAVNMLGGREGVSERARLKYFREFRGRSPSDKLPSVTSFGRKTNPNHAERVRTLLKDATDAGIQKCWVHVTSIAWDVYQSTSNQPMVWCVARLSPHRERDESWREVERRWCLAPACAYLKDPNSFRSILKLRDDIVRESFRYVHELRLAGAAPDDITVAAKQLEEDLVRAGELTRMLEEMNRNKGIDSPIPAVQMERLA